MLYHHTPYMELIGEMWQSGLIESPCKKLIHIIYAAIPYRYYRRP